MNYEQAGLAIEAHVDSTWTTPVAYPNDPDFKKPDTEHAILSYSYVNSFSAALGQSLWRRIGLIGFQIFVPEGDQRGTALLGQLEDAAADMFEGIRLGGDLVIGYDNPGVAIARVGNSDGWFQTNVTAPFRFDQIRS